MSDTSSAQGQQTGAAPVDMKNLLELIHASESMNDEERQYWIAMLPAMKPDQVAQLQSILQNEQEQLAAIDEKYASEIARVQEQKRPIEEMDASMREKREERQRQEEQARAKDESIATNLLNQID